MRQFILDVPSTVGLLILCLAFRPDDRLRPSSALPSLLTSSAFTPIITQGQRRCHQPQHGSQSCRHWMSTNQRGPIGATFRLNSSIDNSSSSNSSTDYDRPTVRTKKQTGPRGAKKGGKAINAPEQRNPSKSRRKPPVRNRVKKKWELRPLDEELKRLRHRQNGVGQAERVLEESLQSMMLDYNMSSTVDISTDSNATTDDGSTTSTTSTNAPAIYLSRTKIYQSNYPDRTNFHTLLAIYSQNSRFDPSAAKKAQTTLDQMKSMSKLFSHLKPQIYTYNAVLEVFTKSYTSDRLKLKGRRHYYKRCIQALFEEIKTTSKPNTFTYNMILSLRTPELEEWREAEAWCLAGVQDDPGTTTANTRYLPDSQSLNSLLRTYAKVGQGDAAQSLLVHLINESQTQRLDESDEDCAIRQKTMMPHIVRFNYVYSALTSYAFIQQTSPREACKRTLQLFALQKRLVADGLENAQPDTVTYNQVISALARDGQTKKALQVLEEHETMASQDPTNKRLKPDLITYSSTLQAFAKEQGQFHHRGLRRQAKSQQQAELAMEVFRRLVEAYRTSGDPEMAPTVRIYNILINIWSAIGSRDGLDKAYSILRDMKALFGVNPDQISYATLIFAWSRSSRTNRLPDAGYRSGNLLNELNQLPHSRLSNMKWTSIINAVISAWARSEHEQAPQQAEELLSMLEDKLATGHPNANPECATFIAIIDAYAKAGIPDALARCDELLERMEDLATTYDIDGLEPTRSLWNAVVNALAKSMQPEAVDRAEEILAMMQASTDDDVKPDIVTYATLIDCHTKCGGDPNRAEELLTFVEETYRNGSTHLCPNGVFYSAILQSYAKQATTEGVTKAENLLKRNSELYEQGKWYAKPNTVMYNAVIDAIARGAGDDAGDKAEALLGQMETMYASGNDDLKPSRRTYNAVILAYCGRSGGSIKAERMLEKMEQFASMHEEVYPDRVTFNAVIGAIVGDPDAEVPADRAQAILDTMKSKSVRPDGRTYSQVIEAWLKCNDDKGRALAEQALGNFMEAIESQKQSGPWLYEEEVWKVVDEYKLLGEDSAARSHQQTQIGSMSSGDEYSFF